MTATRLNPKFRLLETATYNNAKTVNVSGYDEIRFIAKVKMPNNNYRILSSTTVDVDSLDNVEVVYAGGGYAHSTTHAIVLISVSKSGNSLTFGVGNAYVNGTQLQNATAISVYAR